MKKLGLILASAAVAGVLAFSGSQADARSSWSVGFNTGYYPTYGGCGYVAPYRGYYAPAYYGPSYYGPSYPVYPTYSPGYNYGSPVNMSFSYRHR